MGTRGPPQAPPRRLTALRRRHAVGIGAISADLRGRTTCCAYPTRRADLDIGRWRAPTGEHEVRI
jgi:hypothetical protein